MGRPDRGQRLERAGGVGRLQQLVSSDRAAASLVHFSNIQSFGLTTFGLFGINFGKQFFHCFYDETYYKMSVLVLGNTTLN